MKSYIDNGETLSLVNLNTLTVVDIESTRQAAGPDDLTSSQKWSSCSLFAFEKAVAHFN